MANGVLSRLVSSISPKNENYFILFNNLAECVVKGAKTLATMSATDDHALFQKQFEEIRKHESEADEYTKEILLSLHKTFITPFDRREIRELASALDDIVDTCEDIPQRSYVYGHMAFTPEMAALGQILLRAAEKVRDVVILLSDMKNADRILKLCEEISVIEGEGDHVMRAGMKRLFAEETDARNLIRAKELYDLFEAAIDSCEDVADVIHGVVLERI